MITPTPPEAKTMSIDEPEIVLLAVTGMSPAILTETIWALAHPTDGSPAQIPDRVLVVTTRDGRDRMLSLFEPTRDFDNRAPWDALRAALKAAGHSIEGKLRFGSTAHDIRVITATEPKSGRTMELSDLRTPEENEAAADFLLETVRGIVERPDTQLIASIAGGRKTMGALLYACLTLIGREEDQLTHVLVNEPYETLPGFWFPNQPGGLLTFSPRGSDTKKQIAPADAVVQIANVPFVPIRNLFERELGTLPGGFGRLMASARTNVRQQLLANLDVHLHVERREVRVDGKTLTLNAREFMTLYFLADNVRRRQTPYPSYGLAVDPWFAFRDAQQKAAHNDRDWRRDPSLNQNLEERDLTRVLSDLRKKFKNAGAPFTSLVQVLPTKGRCSLDLRPEQIHIHEDSLSVK